MPDYKKAQIYRLWSIHTDKFYIGSTCSPLAKRFYGHKADYIRGKGCTSVELFKLGEVKIELIECFPCDSKAELERREGELMRQHKANLVNQVIAGRTLAEYQEDNHKLIKERNRAYYVAKKALLSTE